jgi:hyperosmotically inducible protein
MRNDIMKTLFNLRSAAATAAFSLAFAAFPLSQAMAQDSGSMQASSDSQSMASETGDAWITTKVKSELGTTKDIKSTDISVTTTDGVVALSGTATSKSEKSHAIHVAKMVKGVKRVDATGLTVSSGM